MNINAGYDGDIYYTIVLNAFVHFVMYGYYELTSFNIQVPKAVKMAITNMQMVQFVMMNAQAIYILYKPCPFPTNITWFYLVYILSLLALFKNFANKTYKSKSKTD